MVDEPRGLRGALFALGRIKQGGIVSPGVGDGLWPSPLPSKGGSHASASNEINNGKEWRAFVGGEQDNEGQGRTGRDTACVSPLHHTLVINGDPAVLLVPHHLCLGTDVCLRPRRIGMISG